MTITVTYKTGSSVLSYPIGPSSPAFKTLEAFTRFAEKQASGERPFEIMNFQNEDGSEIENLDALNEALDAGLGYDELAQLMEDDDLEDSEMLAALDSILGQVQKDSDGNNFLEIDGQQTYLSGDNAGTIYNTNPDFDTTGTAQDSNVNPDTGFIEPTSGGSSSGGTSGTPSSGSSDTPSSTPSNGDTAAPDQASGGGTTSQPGSSASGIPSGTSLTSPSINKLGIPNINSSGESADIINNIINNLNNEKEAYFAVGEFYDLSTGITAQDIFNAPEGAVFNLKDGSTVSKDNLLSSKGFNIETASGFIEPINLDAELQYYESLVKAGVPLEEVQVTPLPPLSITETETPDFNSLLAGQEGTQIGRGEKSQIDDLKGTPEQQVTDITGDSKQ